MSLNIWFECAVFCVCLYLCCLFFYVHIHVTFVFCMVQTQLILPDCLYCMGFMSVCIWLCVWWLVEVMNELQLHGLLVSMDS